MLRVYEHPAEESEFPLLCGGDGDDDDSPGEDPDNSGDNEPPDSDSMDEESWP